MKKFLATLWLLALGVGAFGQTITPPASPPGGATTTLQYNNAGAFGGVSGWTTNGTTALTGGSTSTILSGNGSVGTNSIGIGASNTGFYNNGGYLVAARGGIAQYAVFTDIFVLKSSSLFQWSSGAPDVAAGDTFLGRGAAATLQLGAANSSSAAVAQTFRAQGSSGNSAAAALFTIAGSDQTGTTTTGGAILIRGGNGTSAGGAVRLATSATSTPADRVVIPSTGGLRIGPTALTLTDGALGLNKITASASAPGADGGKLELVCGTNAGTAKLIIYAGTSGTAVTVTDNIGTGVTGC